MKKRLCVMGNSLGVIIDKPIRRALNIGRRAVLDVSTDGQRIIIEPTGELLDESELPNAQKALRVREERTLKRTRSTGVNRQALEVDAHAVFWELTNRWGMGLEQLGKIFHEDKPRIGRVGGWLQERGCVVNANDAELGSVLRMRRCRDRLRAGATWSDAIQDALQAYPKSPCQDSTIAQPSAAVADSRAPTVAAS